MDERRELRIAFLLGSDNEAHRIAIESVCAVSNVRPIVALVDTARQGIGKRIQNARRNIRRDGWKYIPHRIVRATRSLLDELAKRAVVSQDEVRNLLDKAFPQECRSLTRLAQKHGFDVQSAGHLNGPNAINILRQADVDLGVVLGTRLLKECIFSVPRMGCINLHEGKVPEYRGMPPGFWELYDGAETAGVTVHFVDAGLDTGDVIGTCEIKIAKTDTPNSLRQKLHIEGARVLAAAVGSIQVGNVKRRAQPETILRPRSKPTLAQTKELKARLPHWRESSDISAIARNLYCLSLYFTGILSLVRLWHRTSKVRACVLLYHRVNDYSKDILTIDTETFASQLIILAKHYASISSSALVEHIRDRKPIEPTSVAIHFDDCYRDIYTNGAPIIRAMRRSATAFVSSGFVGTSRAFAHDREKYPFQYPNLDAGDIRRWVESGFEVGAHTVNHVDLAKCNLDEARSEIFESRRQLENILKQDTIEHGKLRDRGVTLFSFPFGRVDNIRPEAVAIVREAQYSALFSAHGGFVDRNTDVYDVPRIGCTGNPLYLMLVIEGLAPNQLKQRIRRIFS